MSSPTLDRVLDAVFRVDHQFDIKFISERGLRWLAAASPAVIPKNFLELLNPDDVSRFTEACSNDSDNFACDLRIVKEGLESWVNLRAYRLLGAHQLVLCAFDISTWKSGELTYRHAAEHDELTGLANRAAFKSTVEALLSSGSPVFAIARM